MSKKVRNVTAPGCISCGRPTRSASGFCWQHSDMAKYRQLEEGEIIQAGDQVDASNDGWRDEPRWEPANCIGQPAPNPLYPSHRRYRRQIPPDELLALQLENQMLRDAVLSLAKWFDKGVNCSPPNNLVQAIYDVRSAIDLAEATKG